MLRCIVRTSMLRCVQCEDLYAQVYSVRTSMLRCVQYEDLYAQVYTV